MKRLLIVPFLFLGCANKQISIEEKISQKYNTANILKTKNYFFIYKYTKDGIEIFKLKNDNITQIKKINTPIQKIVSSNNYLYLLGYDENKNRAFVITLDSNLKEKSKKYIAKKFDIPYDMVDKVILLLTYKNQADFKICNKTCKTFSLPDNQFPKFIRKFNNGFLIVGSYQDSKEDLFVVFIRNNKIVWKKRYDFGYSDIPLNVKIKNNKIIIEVDSTDYMGAHKYFIITLNKNGELIKKEKKEELKTLPTHFRT